jgi:hypothetical protein
MTAEELFELPEDHLRHELVEGELRPLAPAGGRHGWGVDPQGRLAAVHHPGGLVTVLREDGALDGEDVLPGFRLPLSLLFA